MDSRSPIGVGDRLRGNDSRRCDRCGGRNCLWIPAYAGMTAEVRGSNGGGVSDVIPAQAGIHRHPRKACPRRKRGGNPLIASGTLMTCEARLSSAGARRPECARGAASLRRAARATPCSTCTTAGCSTPLPPASLRPERRPSGRERQSDAAARREATSFATPRPARSRRRRRPAGSYQFRDPTPCPVEATPPPGGKLPVSRARALPGRGAAPARREATASRRRRTCRAGGGRSPCGSRCRSSLR